MFRPAPIPEDHVLEEALAHPRLDVQAAKELLTATLESAKQMWEAGVMTDEEYEEGRARVLADFFSSSGP